MKALFTFVALFVFALNAFAVENKIAMITSDVEKEVGELRLEVVNGTIDTLRILKVAGQQILDDESHPIERLMAEGLVATERQGRDVVVLKFEGFNPSTGGTVVLDFLANGITNKRKNYKVKLVKEGADFVLKTLQGVRVNRFHFVANRVFGKVVGIDTVQVSFK